MSTPQRPLTLLIAALGGEGGGVLTGWIVDAAAAQSFPVQSTSIPGVAQRTGATTYYIEIMPARWSELGDKRPVLSLVPGAGDIDVMVASELLEAGRAIAGGFVTPERTTLIASTHRILAMSEKMAGGDGQFDMGRLLKAVEEHAQSHALFDMEETARHSGSVISAVMLGAIAGSGRLPIPVEAFEAAIRAEGKAVDANLRGFAAGLSAVRRGSEQARVAGQKRRQPARSTLEAMERQAAETMPRAAIETVLEGVRRLAAYQDLAYAQLYLDRLAPIREADARAAAGGRLLRETARHLAVRMSFEDVIRVAQAKTDPARLARIRADMRPGADEPLVIVDFFKPGIEELCSVLPAFLARPILRVSARRGWLGKVYWGMEVRSNGIAGFLRLKLLASLRRWRRFTHRYAEEQAAIEAWLALIGATAKLSPDLALEVADCARLIKGYGETHARGVANYRKIEARVIRPALAGGYALPVAIDAVAAARTAALADPEGERLEHTLREIEQRATRPIAAE
ncbi:MAG TPA: indolepyruvate oxidoreductase subunit beta family protein [Stellaceae bacterium]|nr:indolepyruvate oxidoreductase subunit beta family protein [Stellaceae bacterium]